MIWDPATGKCRSWEVDIGGDHKRKMSSLQGHTNSCYACFSPTGERIATGSDDKSAKLWDAATGACLLTFNGHAKFIRTIAFNSDGRLIATGSGDTTARIWSAESGDCVQTLEGHESFVYAVAFGDDGDKVATGSADGTGRLWSM